MNRMHWPVCPPSWTFPIHALLLGVALLGPILGARAAEDADRIALAVDALTRMEGVDLNANPVLKERVLKLLDKTRGTPQFVRLVRHFQIPNQDVGLIEAALAAPTEESGIEALRLVLASGRTASLQSLLDGTNAASALKLAQALGNTGQKDAVPLLQKILGSGHSPEILKQQAVRSLVRTVDGSRALLVLARENQLTPDLNDLAGKELRGVRWEEIKTEAAHIFAAPSSSTNKTLPPIADLIKLRGDPLKGELVYSRASPGCIACHVVRGRGTELGPNLTEIGSKLGKDALYQAILEPSAGISFGFEAFTITTADGEEAYGLLASETAEELVLKGVGGITTRIKKSTVVSRQKSTLSIMPAGLEAGMSTQELVDLVEFLSGLKKAN